MRQSLTTIIKDIIKTIEDFFWVETKDGEVIPFILNNKQNELILHILNSTSPLRIIILKGRQFGFSTVILAILLVKCLLVPNTRAVVISHTEDATKKLFRKVKFFISMFPIKPEMNKESEKEYSFPKTNSYFYIGTAGTKSFGRGDNITDLHCSEVAFWDNAGVIMGGLLQAVGKHGNVFIETTANGIGNYFNKVWNKSWNKDKSIWNACFFSWIDFKEYEMDVPEDFKRTEEEQYLCKLYPKLTDRKLMWRRWKLGETETDGSITPEDLFKQEYPLNPQEAFIATGKPVFNQNALMAYKTENGYTEGNLTIFDKPDNSKYYFIGVDVAEGIETGDFSSIEVIDNSLQQVAEWHGLIDPDELAYEIKRIAEIFNEATVGVEANNHGLTTLTVLKGIYPIHKIHHREIIDETYKTKTRKIGWLTTKVSRLYAIADMMSVIREHKLVIRSIKLVSECLSFVRNKDGKPEAQEGCHDDTVMAMAVAIQMWKAYPYLASKPPKPPSVKEQERIFKKKLNRVKSRKVKNTNGYYSI